MVTKDPLNIYGEYQRDLDYKTQMGFTYDWPKYVDFVEGKQWPPATEKTKNMPRPVINICDFTVENKQSNILSQAVKMVYSPEELPEDPALAEQVIQASEDYTDAAENVWHDIDQDGLNEDAVNDAITLGTGIWHFYFDATVHGGTFNKFVGQMVGETIDPMDICFGNPQLKPSQMQKQPYIIIKGRKDTEMLRERAKKTGEGAEHIQSDLDNPDEKYNSGQKDLDKAYKTTTYTKYYRENGEIWWMEVTADAIVQKPRRLSPDKAKPFTLYPIEVLTFKRRKRCIYGRSIVADMIANQRMLNTGLGLMFLSIQQTAWPKVIAKMEALRQPITNEPGEILVDYSSDGVDGVKFMQPPNFSQFPVILTDKLLELTRQVTGVTEVATGEVIGANMAASAIIALQNQAKKPNEMYQQRYFRCVKNIGRIYEEFFKTYYGLPMPITATGDDGEQFTKMFTGTQYADMAFGLEIDVGPASVFSESLQVNIIEKMYDKGDIDKYAYIKYMPKNVVPQDLKQDFDREKQAMQEQMMMQEQAMQAMPQGPPPIDAGQPMPPQVT